MRILLKSVICICICVINLYAAKSLDSNLVWLVNDKIEVGILPEVGGRIVVLRKPGGMNMLKSEALQWQPPWPEISLQAGFIPYNGHIVWLGPQQKWWARQDLNDQRKNRQADWPPDPYLIYGHYKITKSDSNSLEMTGPVSPVSGVKLIKRVTISETGDVIFHASAVGTRETSVAWDLWMNTRMDGFNKAYVPVTGRENLYFRYTETDRLEPTPFEIIGGYFTFLPSMPIKGEQVQEVHIHPSTPLIAGVKNGNMLLIQFELIEKNTCSPGHSQVEIYNSVAPAGNLLELEVHGQYAEISYRDTLSMEIKWTILHCGKTETEVLAQLNNYQSKFFLK